MSFPFNLQVVRVQFLIAILFSNRFPASKGDHSVDTAIYQLYSIEVTAEPLLTKKDIAFLKGGPPFTNEWEFLTFLLPMA